MQLDLFIIIKNDSFICGNSSGGRALASQAKGRGFEPRFPLHLE